MSRQDQILRQVKSCEILDVNDHNHLGRKFETLDSEHKTEVEEN